MKNKENYWFERRKFGWMPVSMMGWLSVAVFWVVTIVSAVFLFPQRNKEPEGVALILFAMIVFSFAMILTGLIIKNSGPGSVQMGDHKKDNE